MKLYARLLWIAALIIIAAAAWQFFKGQEAIQEEDRISLGSSKAKIASDTPEAVALIKFDPLSLISKEKSRPCPASGFVKDIYCMDCQFTRDEDGNVSQESLDQAKRFNKWQWTDKDNRQWYTPDNLVVFHNPEDKFSTSEARDIFHGMYSNHGSTDERGTCSHGQWPKPVVRCRHKWGESHCSLKGEKCITYHDPNESGDTKKWDMVKMIECGTARTPANIQLTPGYTTVPCPHPHFMRDHYCKECKLRSTSLDHLDQHTIDEALAHSDRNMPRWEVNIVVLHDSETAYDDEGTWGAVTEVGNRDQYYTDTCSHRSSWKPVLRCTNSTRTCEMMLPDIHMQEDDSVLGQDLKRDTSECITFHLPDLEGELFHWITCKDAHGQSTRWKFIRD